MTLYNLKENESGKLRTIPANDLLKSLGVREGIEIKIKSKQPFGGPVVIRIGRRDIAVAKDIAKKITIKKLATSHKEFSDKQVLAEEVS